MNILVANSRGAGMRELIPNSILQRVIFRPGARISSLGQIATKSFIQSNSPSDTHVYIMAGIPDITTKLKSQNYEEVIYLENPEITKSRVLNIYRETKNQLEKLKIKPIFCTISTMHLEKWNLTRQKQNKTTHLKYSGQYGEMKKNLTQQ